MAMKRCLEICSISSEFSGGFIKNMDMLIDRTEKDQIQVGSVFPIGAEKFLVSAAFR